MPENDNPDQVTPDENSASAYVGAEAGLVVAAKQVYTAPSRAINNVAKGLETQVAKDIKTANKISKTAEQAKNFAAKSEQYEKAAVEIKKLSADPPSSWRAARNLRKSQTNLEKATARVAKDADNVAKASEKAVAEGIGKFEKSANQYEKLSAKANRAGRIAGKETANNLNYLIKDEAAASVKQFAGKAITDSSGLAGDLKTASALAKGEAFAARGGSLLKGAPKAVGVLGKTGKVLGRVAVPLAVGLAGYEMYQGYKTGDNKKFAAATGDAVGGLAGGIAGAEAGAAIGGAIGAFFGGVGAVPGAIIGGVIGGIGGAIGGSWGGRKIAAVTVGAPSENQILAGNKSPNSNAEWTALNMERLKNNDFHGNTQEMDKLAKAYGFEDAGQAHYAINKWHVQSAGEMRVLMQAASDAHAKSTDDFLQGRNGHDVVAKLISDQQQNASNQQKPSPFVASQQPDQNPAIDPQPATIVRVDYSLTSKDNFGANNAELEPSLKASLQSAKSADGKAYFDPTDKRPNATIWALQGFLQDKGYYKEPFTGSDGKQHASTLDGKAGEGTRMALRQYLHDKWGYEGKVDGRALDGDTLESLQKATGKNFAEPKAAAATVEVSKITDLPLTGRPYMDLRLIDPVIAETPSTPEALTSRVSLNPANPNRAALKQMPEGKGHESGNQLDPVTEHKIHGDHRWSTKPDGSNKEEWRIEDKAAHQKAHVKIEATKIGKQGSSIKVTREDEKPDLTGQRKDKSQTVALIEFDQKGNVIGGNITHSENGRVKQSIGLGPNGAPQDGQKLSDDQQKMVAQARQKHDQEMALANKQQTKQSIKSGLSV